MAHQHPVKDTDLHFVIDPVTRVVKNNSGKIVIMQHDHQSEILTFELPRYIDTHDMSLSNTVRVHYINIGTSSKYTPVSGVYEVNDLQVDATNENLVTCSWTLTNNATQLEGTLNFIIRFSCLTGDTIDYSWSTAIYSGIIVAKTIDSSDYVMTAIPDILEQWKESLKGDPFTYEDFTPEQLEALRGPAGIPGIPGIVVSNDEPTASEHPVWLNPDGNIVDVGTSSASIYYINLAGNYPNYTCPVTRDDIKAAYNSGKNLVCRCQMGAYTATLPLFIPKPDANTWIFSGSGALELDGVTFKAQSFTIAITTNGVVAQNTLLAKNDTAISLGMTTAAVGQTIKVSTVDASGKPTSWEAVDMPSGGEREWIKIGEVTTAEDATDSFYVKFTKDINGNSLSLKGVIIIGTPLFSDTNAHRCALKCNDSPYGGGANFFLDRSILRNKQTFTIYSEFLRGDGVNSVVVTVSNSGNVKQNGGAESSINTWSPSKKEFLQFPMRGIDFGVMDSGLLAGSKFEFWGVKA